MADLIDNPERAKRIARTVASDIFLYNEDRIAKGIADDNLFELLEDQIEQGKSHYLGRIAPSILENTNHFDKAVVDKVLARAGHVPSSIW